MTGPASFDHIFVGGLPRGTTEAELRAAFAYAGTEVGVIELVIDRVTGTQRGFAFVSLLARLEIAADELLLDRLRSATLDGRVLDVQGVPERRLAHRELSLRS